MQGNFTSSAKTIKFHAISRKFKDRKIWLINIGVPFKESVFYPRPIKKKRSKNIFPRAGRTTSDLEQIFVRYYP